MEGQEHIYHRLAQDMEAGKLSVKTSYLDTATRIFGCPVMIARVSERTRDRFAKWQNRIKETVGSGRMKVTDPNNLHVTMLRVPERTGYQPDIETLRTSTGVQTMKTIIWNQLSQTHQAFGEVSYPSRELVPHPIIVNSDCALAAGMPNETAFNNLRTLFGCMTPDIREFFGLKKIDDEHYSGFPWGFHTTQGRWVVEEILDEKTTAQLKRDSEIEIPRWDLEQVEITLQQNTPINQGGKGYQMIPIEVFRFNNGRWKLAD